MDQACVRINKLGPTWTTSHSTINTSHIDHGRFKQRVVDLAITETLQKKVGFQHRRVTWEVRSYATIWCPRNLKKQLQLLSCTSPAPFTLVGPDLKWPGAQQHMHPQKLYDEALLSYLLTIAFSGAPSGHLYIKLSLDYIQDWLRAHACIWELWVFGKAGSIVDCFQSGSGSAFPRRRIDFELN